MITDYYDSLIRHVDIYTESELDKYSQSDSSSFNSVFTKKKKIKLDVCEVLNNKRDELIDRLRKWQKRTLAHYESIKNELKVIDKSATTASEEIVDREINSRLFKNSFAFLFFNTKPRFNTSNTFSAFQLYLVELDFYLTKHEKALLKYSNFCLFL